MSSLQVCKSFRIKITQSPHDLMVQADPHQTRLPSSSELPCSDDMPVDNENQNFVPNLLLFLLEFIWRDRLDWYFAADMGIYQTTGAISREILTWYDASGTRYLAPEEIVNQQQQRADQERQARLDAVLNLLNMGLSAEQVAKALSLSVEEVRSLSN
jgi:Uma2 family endonuclease